MAKAGISDRQKLEGCLAGARMVLEGKECLGPESYIGISQATDWTRMDGCDGGAMADREGRLRAH